VIPIRQRYRNDCLPACLASLLEVPLPLVPNYARLAGPEQWRRTLDWLGRLGLTAIDVPIRKGRSPTQSLRPVFAIATVAIPSEKKWVHAIVVRVGRSDIEWVHDPAGNERSAYWRMLSLTFLVPIDPKALKP
jgi:hypothetical protein